MKKKQVDFEVKYQASFHISSLGKLDKRMAMQYPLPEIKLPLIEHHYCSAIEDIPSMADSLPVWIFERSGGDIAEEWDTWDKTITRVIPYIFVRIER